MVQSFTIGKSIVGDSRMRLLGVERDQMRAAIKGPLSNRGNRCRNAETATKRGAAIECPVANGDHSDGQRERSGPTSAALKGG